MRSRLILPSVNHYEYPLLTTDDADRAFVNASSWLACVIGDSRHLRILSSTGYRVSYIDTRGFTGGLDGRRSQTRVMPIIYHVEEGKHQIYCHEVESVRSALHSEKCVIN